MRKLFSMIAAVLFAGSMFAAVQEFTMTISPSDFNSTSYAANNNEKTTIAVATADPSVTMEVKWTSNQVMLGSQKIQGQKTNGQIFNTASWGKIKSVTINDNENGYTYIIGSEAKPTTAVTDGGFFIVKAGTSKASYCTSIVIKFEADPAAASLHADDVELGDMLVEPDEAFEKVVSINVEASNLSAPIAFSTESPMLSFVTPGTTLPATGGELKVKIVANHGDVINETVLLSSGSLSATVTISGEVWEKYYTPGSVDVKFEAGVKAQGGDTTTVNGQKAVKVGTSNDPGTAIITIPAGATKLYFLAAAWSGKPCTITLSDSEIDFSPTTADLKADAGIANSSPFVTKSGNLEQYLVEVELNNVGAETEMTVTATGTNKRFVIWDVTCDKGDTPTPPTPTPGDTVKMVYTAAEGLEWLDNTATTGYWDFYVDGVFELSNSYSTTAAGTYAFDDLDPDYCYVVSGSDTIYFAKGDGVVVAVDGDIVTLKGNLTGTDDVVYAFDLYYDPSQVDPYSYDEDEDFTATFSSYSVKEVSDGVFSIMAVSDGKGVEMTAFLPTGATAEQAAGKTFPINDSGDEQTVAAGYYDGTEGVMPSYACLINASYQITNVWYLVSGTATVDANLNITVAAKNSKGRNINIKLNYPSTGIQDAKAVEKLVKFIQNGQIMINVNGAQYNVNGARVK